MMKISYPAKATAACLLSLFFAHKVLADQVQYKVDGWCLAHEAGAVEFASDNPAARASSPLFKVPSRIPTLSISDAPEATGLTVNFWKRGESYYSDQVNLRRQASEEGCLGQEHGNGLIEYVQNTGGGQQPDPGSHCREHPWRKVYVTTDDHPGTETIRISCPMSTYVVACKMRDVMENGWVAHISLPKVNLGDWKQARDDARAFFETTLTDCG